MGTMLIATEGAPSTYVPFKASQCLAPSMTNPWCCFVLTTRSLSQKLHPLLRNGLDGPYRSCRKDVSRPLIHSVLCLRLQLTKTVQEALLMDSVASSWCTRGWEVPPKGVSTRQIVGQWKLLLALPCHGKRGTAHVHSLWKRCWASNYAHNDSRLHWEYCPVSINHLCSWLEHGYDCLWLDAHRRFVHYPRVCSFSFDLWLTSGFVFHYSLGSLIWTIWGSNWRQEVLRSLDMALSKKNFVQHMHSSAKLAAYGGSATWMHIVKLGMALRLGHAAHIWLLNSGLNVSYQFTAFILFFL